MPRHERLALRQPVERIVDLDGGEVPGVVLQPAPLRQAGRVEPVPPVLVLPAAGTDEDHAFPVPRGNASTHVGVRTGTASPVGRGSPVAGSSANETTESDRSFATMSRSSTISKWRGQEPSQD